LMREGAQETEKLLAENPGELKSPMYLVGKIGDREIRVVAKNGELVINEENTPSAAVESHPEKEVELEEAENILHDRGSEDGGDKNEEHVAVVSTTKPGESGGDGDVPSINGGPVAPADKRDGEVGSSAIGAEREEENGRSVQGTICEQGRILQVDASGNGRDEGIAETSRSWQESEEHAAGESSTQKTGKGEQAAAEGKSACGDIVPDSKDVGAVAERGAVAE
jgi:hypothetical protein